MPAQPQQVSIEQEVINRLQMQIGSMAGQLTMKEIALELIMRERDALQQIVTALGGELPPSQVKRVEADGSGTAEDSGAPDTGEASGATREARSEKSQLQD